MQVRLGLRRLFFAGWWMSLTLLGACATVQAPSLTSHDAEQRWEIRRAQLAGLVHFTVAGRIGVQSEQEGWHVAVRWQQDDAQFHMLFNAPLGQGSAALEGNELKVTLTLTDGRRWTASDADSLVAQVFGTPLPVSGLRYWMRGLPVPEAAAIRTLDGQGRLQSLEQSGWRIAYRAYQSVDGNDLPTKLFMENDTYKVRLVVDTWTLS